MNLFFKKNKIKPSRIMLLEVFLTLTVAILVLSYASYAWLTFSRTATASGINLNVTAPDNLLISQTGEDGSWQNDLVVDMNQIKALYSISSTKNILVKPASSLNGFDGSFYKTESALASGAAYPNAVFETATPGFTYDSLEDDYEGYYIDIPLYFKTMGQFGLDIYLDKNSGTSINTGIYPQNSDENVYKTARVAFLNETCDKNSDGGTTPLILASDVRGAMANGAITSSTIPGGAPSAISYLNFTDGHYSDSKMFSLQAADFTSSPAQYFIKKIIVRIWIEGQDENCMAGIGGQTFNVKLRFSVKG